MTKFKNLMNKISYYVRNLLLNGIASSIFTPPILRLALYRMLGYKIGKPAMIHAQCFCGIGSKDKGKLILGEGSFINYRCFLDLGDDIIIGNHVAVAFGCTFINSSHKVGNASKRSGEGYSKAIIVGDGCWIGANVTIMPGVTIAQGCIIAANSLVLHDTNANGLYAGSPARRIKDL